MEQLGQLGESKIKFEFAGFIYEVNSIEEYKQILINIQLRDYE